MITGCDSGIGRESALLLKKTGFTVVAGIFTEEGEKSLLKENTSDLEGVIVPFKVDITNDESVEEVTITKNSSHFEHFTK